MLALLAAFSTVFVLDQAVAAQPVADAKTQPKVSASKSSKKSKTSAKSKKSKLSQRDLDAKAQSVALQAEERARIQRELDAQASAVERAAEEEALADASDWESDPNVGPDGTHLAQPLFDWTERKFPVVAETQERPLHRYASEVYGLLSTGDLFQGESFIPANSPIRGESCYISCDFGLRKNPFRRKRKEFHNGLDIAGPWKTPIVATADGVVEMSQASRGYGNVVWINHGNGYITGFAHLAKRIVKPGQYVSRGSVVGYMGRTGRATGTHLHYMVKYNDRFVDPTSFLGQKALAAFTNANPLLPKTAKTTAVETVADANSDASAPLNDLVLQGRLALSASPKSSREPLASVSPAQDLLVAEMREGHLMGPVIGTPLMGSREHNQATVESQGVAASASSTL